MRVAGDEMPAPEALEVAMVADRLHELLCDALSAMRRQDEHVRDVAVRRVVRDHAREAYLHVVVVRAEAERVLDRALDEIERDAARPVRRLGQEAMNDVDVESIGVRADLNHWFLGCAVARLRGM